MRDARALKYGLETYYLLPTFEVLDRFETIHGSIIQHLIGLSTAAVTVRQRAQLLLECGHAGGQEKWDLEAVMRMMFELGIADETLAGIEIDLCRALIYTPEQYQKKKAEWAAAETAQTEIETIMGGLNSVSTRQPRS